MTKERGRPRRWVGRWARRLIGGAVALASLWLLADLAYAFYIREAYERWDAGIERDAGGVRRGCREFTVGSGSSAILLIHGFADSPAIFRPMAASLARHGFTCRAMRLPGFATDMERYEKSTVADWRRAVSSEVAALRRSHPRVAVVAHSLGAAVALSCLADSTDADAFVLFAPLLEVSDRSSPLLSTEAWHHIIDHLLVFTDRFGVTFPLFEGNGRLGNIVPADPYIPRSVIREVFEVVDQNRARKIALRRPLLVFLADDDPVIDNDAAERFFARCAGAPKRLLRVSHSTHLLPIDPDWQALADQTASFLSEVEAPAVANARVLPSDPLIPLLTSN